MSELIVVGFQGELRAAQVINELRLLHRDASEIVDHAVVVTRDQRDRLRVHRTVDPTSEAEAAWTSVWNSLINAAILIFARDELPTATCVAGAVVPTPAARSSYRTAPHPDARWWMEAMCISDDFVGDLGAVLRRDCSAIFMLTRMADSPCVVQQLRRSGGIFLRLSLAPEHDAMLNAVLSGGPACCESNGNGAEP
jgi:uncharacterized membrane protein